MNKKRRKDKTIFIKNNLKYDLKSNNLNINHYQSEDINIFIVYIQRVFLIKQCIIKLIWSNNLVVIEKEIFFERKVRFKKNKY